MKIYRLKFVGACHECGEPAKNAIDLHWAGLTIRLCDKHMLHQPSQKNQTKPKPKKEIY